MDVAVRCVCTMQANQVHRVIVVGYSMCFLNFAQTAFTLARNYFVQPKSPHSLHSLSLSFWLVSRPTVRCLRPTGGHVIRPIELMKNGQLWVMHKSVYIQTEGHRYYFLYIFFPLPFRRFFCVGFASCVDVVFVLCNSNHLTFSDGINILFDKFQ